MSAAQWAATAAAASCAGLPDAGTAAARVGPEAGGIGVEAEDDLALAVGDPGGEAVAEAHRRDASSGSGCWRPRPQAPADAPRRDDGPSERSATM